MLFDDKVQVVGPKKQRVYQGNKKEDLVCCGVSD